MSRPLRIELAGGLYHVTSRGDRREAIYGNDQDRIDWLEDNRGQNTVCSESRIKIRLTSGSPTTPASARSSEHDLGF
ncbi:MAG: hypothetical protein EHM38_11250 [Geobacteraceae bacterium]|nr:MAG: hypothetical protein EHM38_11250 [Geobacteraceae bacterium]